MRQGKGAPYGAAGTGNGSRQEQRSPLTYANRNARRFFSRNTSERPRRTIPCRLLSMVVAVLLVISLSHSAQAGSTRYTCKDGYQTSSSNGCNGHGGVKSTTVYPLCGDGILDAGEACDNGSGNSDVAPDSCRTDCRRAYCGDAVIDRGEQCDDGSRNRSNLPNTCREDCTLPVCGDGIVDDGSHAATKTAFNEACDDGNSDDSDGCTSQCRECLPLDRAGNIEITTSTDLCPAEYQMDDYGDYGAIIIKASGVTLDCHGATLIGEGRGVGIVDFRSNDVTIKNCQIRGYEVGIRIQDARNVTLQGNTTCGNGRRNIELVDASDINGYNPSMAAVTACVERQMSKAGINQHAVVQSGPKASGQKDSSAPPKAAAGIGRTVDMKAAKTSPALTKPQGKRPSGQTAKADTHLLYRMAEQAQWTSKSAKVMFGSDRVPEAGSVRVMQNGRLADGHAASNLLYTQPDWKKGGYLEGAFPALKFKSGMHFQSTVALLKGADPSDALSFEVIIREGRRDTVVKTQPLRGSQRVTLDVDLSRWQGKEARLILRVRRVKGSKSLPAVWVNPVLVGMP